MNICGVDLTASDAVICLLEMNKDQLHLPDCRVRKITLKKSHTTEDLRQFQQEFAKLMEDYQVEKVVIRERMPKGKFAGGAVSFKLEAAIQLVLKLEVSLISPSKIKSMLLEHPVMIDFSDTGLKVFQETAFKTAYAACWVK